MWTARRIKSLFSIPSDNPELMRSQVEGLTRQIPLLYFILVVNTLAVSFTFLGRAPSWLAVYFPCLLCLGSAVRAIVWWRKRPGTLTPNESAALLRRTVLLTALFGAVYTAWALSLYRYGDAYAQAHVAFYMAITVIGCIFCLMHLRPAALFLTGIVLVPWAIVFGMSGQPVFVAIVINIMLVAAAMVIILFINYRDFANLIEWKKQLVMQQAATQRLSDENFRIANLDSLTGLPNRRSFLSALDVALQNANANGGRFVVGLVDLDRFKQVNDAFGHSIGDKVLIEAARRLEGVANNGVLIARLGGDEFGLLVNDDLNAAEVRALGARVCESLKGSYCVLNAVADLAGSAGFATFPEAGRTSEQLFERADYAMYHAKNHACGSSITFSSDHETQIKRECLLEQELRVAVREERLSLAFQPIVDMETERTIGFEALARWESDTVGNVSPDEFIRLAERSDLINALTEVLLRKALKAVASWPDELYVAFNLSTRDIASSEHIQRVVNIVSQSGVPARRIEFEITETAVMPDIEQACLALLALKQTGARVALDDFGSGYSSLSYVHRLPLDKIKIDRSFVGQLDGDEACTNIVRTIVDLCRTLRLESVVEGVETGKQKRTLLALGCKIGQGYLFGKPMKSSDVIVYLDDLNVGSH